jgi:RNA polymerase sigma-70 factor (sigma-E family)
MTAAKSGDATDRPVREAEALAMGGAEAAPAAARAAAGEWESHREVVALYTAHYRPLVRLAVLLVRDVATAEEIVQDAFVAMHAHGRRLNDSSKTTAYLRRCVVNRSCSVLRHRKVAERNMPQPPPEMPSAEQEAVALLERSAVIAALHGLAPRQREAIALRYYADLSEAEIAAVMGISRGAVKSHIARAMSALRDVLGV